MLPLIQTAVELCLCIPLCMIAVALWRLASHEPAPETPRVFAKPPAKAQNWETTAYLALYDTAL